MFVLANGKWHRLDLSEGETQQLRYANNWEDVKGLDYLTFTQWTTDGIDALSRESFRNRPDVANCR